MQVKLKKYYSIFLVLYLIALILLARALKTAARIDALVPSIRFDSILIHPKRSNYRVFLTEEPVPHRSRYYHETYLEGYDGDFGGVDVSLEISLEARSHVNTLVEGRIIAFLSASFNDEVNELLTWFIKMIESVGIEVNWLKEKYQVRPTEEKIKENIAISNCFIQIITSDISREGREAGCARAQLEETLLGIQGCLLGLV